MNIVFFKYSYFYCLFLTSTSTFTGFHSTSLGSTLGCRERRGRGGELNCSERNLRSKTIPYILCTPKGLKTKCLNKKILTDELSTKRCTLVTRFVILGTTLIHHVRDGSILVYLLILLNCLCNFVTPNVRFSLLILVKLPPPYCFTSYLPFFLPFCLLPFFLLLTKVFVLSYYIFLLGFLIFIHGLYNMKTSFGWKGLRRTEKQNILFLGYQIIQNNYYYITLKWRGV